MEDYDASPQKHELVLTIKETGQRIVFPTTEAEPTGTSYVRVLSASGKEEGYWIADEWEREPEAVMGALLGALCSTEENA